MSHGDGFADARIQVLESRKRKGTHLQSESTLGQSESTIGSETNKLKYFERIHGLVTQSNSRFVDVFDSHWLRGQRLLIYPQSYLVSYSIQCL